MDSKKCVNVTGDAVQGSTKVNVLANLNLILHSLSVSHTSKRFDRLYSWHEILHPVKFCL